MALQPTELELSDLSVAVKKLWELDDNRCLAPATPAAQAAALYCTVLLAAKAAYS
jgi:hypothetical protein